ncbi:KaiC domain-containing protein [Halobacteriales archaeon Cl-PHB]
MSEDADDDWFESAVGDAESDDPTADADATDDTAADEDFGPEGGFGADTDDGGFDADAFGGEATPDAGSTDDGAQFGDDGPNFGSGSSEGGVFDDDFASAFDAAGGDEDFDDEDFESDIPRIDVGIEGLDDMIQGGVPQRHLIVAIGSAGTGKTTFGLQFLYHGLKAGEKGVFITLEQSREAILDTANEWGWNFEAYEDDDDLAIVDLDPVEMANSLDNIRGELPDLVEDFGADRLVLDSVSLLEMMYDDQSKRRTEVFDFTRSLKDAGVTTFLTSEASETNPYASRFGIIEYLTDAVFVLQYVRSESRETRLAVEIQKIRNANHSREKKPYEITSDGISVYQQANIF